jgi:ribulose-bisphosphate carboxylase small chain
MRVTQGTFSFLPDLTDDQIHKQIEYAIENGWALNVEFTDDIHPRNTYWEMWELPMFDIEDAAAVMYEVNACREAYPNHYVRVNAFDATKGWETPRLSFIVNRPPKEPGYRLERQGGRSRNIAYKIQPYAVERPAGERYGD